MQETLIIIPTYKQFDCARNCLLSLNRGVYLPYRGIIIDDASSNWNELPFDYWPQDTSTIHFDKQAGLTRSWNHGLQLARNLNYTYAVCANSDLLFSSTWYEPLKQALETYDLVGPVTNAPGHCPWQSIKSYFKLEEVSDNLEIIDEQALFIQSLKKKPLRNSVNGFCMMARVETWWKGAHSSEFVFNPKYKMTGNEDELQRRWRHLKFRSVYVPDSYVFHYRSMSRDDGLNKPNEARGAYRDGRMIAK